VTEPYRRNPHAPAHLNKQAREEAIKRGETPAPQASAQESTHEGKQAEEDAVQSGTAGHGARRDGDEIA
jgi:hypothetical protein